MAKFYLETHKYAPELNRVIFLKGGSLKAPNVTTIKQAREKLFLPVNGYRMSYIHVNVPSNPEYNRDYNGMATYETTLHYLGQLKEKHNLPDTTFKVTTKLIG